MKTARHIHHYMTLICALSVMAFTACDKHAHENEYLLGTGEGAFIIGLQSDTSPDCLSVYLHGSDGTLTLRKDYTDPRVLASEHLPVRADGYIIMVVANIPAADLPEGTTATDLSEWLDENGSAYPDLLTASVQESVAAGEVKRLLLTLQGRTSGIALSTMRLLLTVPGTDLAASAATRSPGSGYDLRLTAEVYKQGTTDCVLSHALLCTAQEDSTYLAEFSILEGDYDLRLWADWTNDGTTDDKYYNADDLSAVTVLTDNYVADMQTDEKDAYYATQSVSLTEGVQDVSVTLERPLARYRIVATDVEAYLNLSDKSEDLPPIGDLIVRVSYEGFFPTGFNVAGGSPNDALTGIGYSSSINKADGYDWDEARQIGEDFVLADSDGSFVTVTVSITYRVTGATVSTTTGIQIPYRRGYLTTVTGNFLTAGRTSGGVQVDTEWDEEIVVEF